MCYQSGGTTAPVACTGKRRRAVITDLLDAHPEVRLEIEPSKPAEDIDNEAVKSSLSDEGNREARFLNGLLYWITTTTTSTSTVIQSTVTIASVYCTPAGGVLCGR